MLDEFFTDDEEFEDATDTLPESEPTTTTTQQATATEVDQNE